jgi:hypothetical protein
MMGENIDTDDFPTQEAAIQSALETLQPGERIVVCRGDWATCTMGRESGCEFCARVPYRPGLTAADVMAAARGN